LNDLEKFKGDFENLGKASNTFTLEMKESIKKLKQRETATKEKLSSSQNVLKQCELELGIELYNL
jgi:hypothetical protein